MLHWWMCASKADREGIETGRWLREVCGASVLFVTARHDDDTVSRIHQRVPGAPVVRKPVYRKYLADAVAQVGEGLTGTGFRLRRPKMTVAALAF